MKFDAQPTEPLRRGPHSGHAQDTNGSATSSAAGSCRMRTSPAPSSPTGAGGGRVVTVAVNDFVFVSPVYVGDVVSFYTDVARVGNTSIAIDVTVFSQRSDGERDLTVKVATAQLTYVRVGANRRPCRWPTRLPERALAGARQACDRMTAPGSPARDFLGRTTSYCCREGSREAYGTATARPRTHQAILALKRSQAREPG